ncbi:MAG: nuclear transport factor 2 family protein [Vicinamibacteria bacterium]
MLSLLLVVALAAQGPAKAEGKPMPSTPTVEAAQDARFAAILKADVAYLEAALDPSLTYQHSTGVAQDKTAFIAAIRDRVFQYKVLDVVERHVRRFGSVAVITGVIHLQVLRDGQTTDSRARFTDVYEWRSGRFIQIAWQNTRIP